MTPDPIALAYIDAARAKAREPLLALTYWANTPTRHHALAWRNARLGGGNAKDRRKRMRRSPWVEPVSIAELFKGPPAGYGYDVGPSIIRRVPWERDPAEIEAKRSLLADVFSTAMDFPPGVKITFGDEP